jgi:hypothetical protein
VSTLFASFLGDNPIGHLLAGSGVLTTLPPRSVAVLTGTTFFPRLVSGPFHRGLVTVFAAAAAMAAIAALASLLRGRQHPTHHQSRPETAPGANPAVHTDAAGGRAHEHVDTVIRGKDW